MARSGRARALGLVLALSALSAPLTALGGCTTGRGTDDTGPALQRAAYEDDAGGRAAVTSRRSSRVSGAATAATATRAPAVAAASTSSSATSPTKTPKTTNQSSATSTSSTVVDPTLVGPCLPLYGPGTPVPLTVSTKGGRVVMSWWHNGDPAAIAYWIGVTTDDSVLPVSASASTSTAPPTPSSLSRQTVTWLRVAPPVYCQTIRYTVPGLVRGKSYILMLNLEAKTPETYAGVSRVMLNQAGARLP